MKMKLLFLVGLAGSLALFSESAGAQTLPRVELHNVFPATTFDRALWMSESPDGTGRTFVVEQAGKIFVIPKGSDGAKKTEFFNIVDRHPSVDNEEGLLSLAFHPGYQTNGLFYVYYNQQNENQNGQFPRRSVISEFKVSATDPNQADLKSERILLEVPQPFGNHKGGELAFGPDGYLYLSLGDGGAGCDPFGSGQNTATLLAKMLRIDVNSRSGGGFGRRPLAYGIPKDNPFIHEPGMDGLGARREIFAYGLRNVWRYSFDRQTGDLWAGDVGQDLWEEVDLIVKGGNYGWSVREGTHHFKPGPPGAQYDEPVMEYAHRPDMVGQGKFPDHSIGLCVVGGYVYRGKKYPSLQGVYIYGDYNLGTIWGLRYENGKITQSATLLEQPKNIVSFAEDADGELYALIFDAGVFSISPARGK